MPSPALFGISVAFGLAIWGGSSVALYLARAKGEPQPRELEPNPAPAWLQVPRIGICSAGGCVSRAACRICSTSGLRRSRNRRAGFARSDHPGNRYRVQC
jgi:hypothetical protein